VSADNIASAAATFCATLVDEWVSAGLRHAIVAPGSRSTPLAVALVADRRVSVEIVHDERAAAFMALGAGVNGIPAVLVCTSGTAAANFLPAVVEAGLSDIPMLVCTADRPPELRGVGAPQTIDQIGLYGGSVRWFHDAPVPSDADPTGWRRLARSAWQVARTGPVHLNLPFREPLLGRPDELPVPDGDDLVDEVRDIVAPTIVSDPVPELPDGPGVVLVGGRHGCDPADIMSLADSLGWPVLADPLAGLHGDERVIRHADTVLRVGEVATRLTPASVIRIGRPHASRVVSTWVRNSGAPVVQVGGPGRIDPDHNVVAHASLNAVVAAAVQCPTADPQWCADWAQTEAIAADAVARLLSGPELTEPTVARMVADLLGADSRLVVSSSMPVRDLEWFGGVAARAWSNRGANGIDGVMSTAVGLALDGDPVVVLIGDVAFVHDANALVALTQRSADVRIVVVDNDGGGIFSFLPQASQLDDRAFEQIFGTPHGTDVLALAAAHHISTVDIADRAGLEAQLGRRGPWVARVRSSRRRNVDVHRRIVDAVAERLA